MLIGVASLYYTMVRSYNLQPVDQAENICGVLLKKNLNCKLKNMQFLSAFSVIFMHGLFFI